MTLLPSKLFSFLSGRRFYRHFTNSPASKPGFLPFESVQKLAARKSVSVRSSLPESISGLFVKYDRNRPLPNLKGAIHPSEVEQLVAAYPNQSKPNILDMLNIPIPNHPTSLFQSLLNEVTETGSSHSHNDNFIECANVLKKRRRRMRGHKHKKRLKEKRHKADK